MKTTQPSAGAMRAAATILTANDPAYLIANATAEDEQIALAEIIDRETAAPEMLAALKEIMIHWNPETGRRLERLVGTSTLNVAQAAIAKAEEVA